MTRELEGIVGELMATVGVAFHHQHISLILRTSLSDIFKGAVSFPFTTKLANCSPLSLTFINNKAVFVFLYIILEPSIIPYSISIIYVTKSLTRGFFRSSFFADDIESFGERVTT